VTAMTMKPDVISRYLAGIASAINKHPHVYESFNATQSLLQGLVRAHAPLSDNLTPFSGIFESLGRMFKNSDRAKAVLDSGWVPYAGMSIEKIEADWSSHDISEFMNDLLETDWLTVREQLLWTVQNSGADQEAQDTFSEALNAFNSGYYRSVVRVVFPEIERVACQTIYGGSRQDWSFKTNQAAGRQNTSLGALRRALMDHLPAGMAVHADLGFALTEMLDKHLYAHVGSEKEELEKFRSNPIPNRHASQHGYLIYSSKQHAFNALSMTAFMFDCIMKVNKNIQNNLGDLKGRAAKPPTAYDT
jgi:hypothetical protein